jgi:hypothetical protein
LMPGYGTPIAGLRRRPLRERAARRPAMPLRLTKMYGVEEN